MIKYLSLVAVLLVATLATQGQVTVAGPVKIAGPVTVGSPGGTVFTFVSPGAQTPSCSASATTCTVTLTVANGDMPVADVECRDATASQNPGLTTDSAGNTWSNSIAPAQQSGSYYNRQDWVVAAGGITTITANCGAATVNTIMNVTVYHRTAGTWIFGAATTNAFGTGTTATSSSVTPTASLPAVVHGYFMNTTNSTAVWVTSTTTIRVNQGASDASYLIGSGDQITASASGSFTAVATNGTSVAWQAWASWWK